MISRDLYSQVKTASCSLSPRFFSIHTATSVKLNFRFFKMLIKRVSKTILGAAFALTEQVISDCFLNIPQVNV